MILKKGNQVKIITGKDKGKTGEILEIDRKLNKIKIKSIRQDIDPKITSKIWKNMIWSYIDYERRNFKKK